MPQVIWSGALSFGLVTVPVSMYSAVESHDVRFHQIERGTTDRVRQQRVNDRTGEEVPFDDVIKGYDLGAEQYVPIEPDELDGIAPGRSRLLEVKAFVDIAAVDPIYFRSTFYLSPRGEEFAKIYALLLAALEDSGQVGIGTLTMRGKEYLAAIRPANGVLQLHTLRYEDEVRDPAVEIPDLPERGGVDAEALEATRQLIDAMTQPWRPEQYVDHYQVQVRELIDAKAEGHEVQKAEPLAGLDTTNVVDLMEALRASIDRTSAVQHRAKKDKLRKKTA
jgi:DNA end-binding protein Ku